MVKYIGGFIYTLMLAVIASTTLVNGQWNPKNPYVDENHGGNTKDISVVGAGENKKDSFLNVVKGAINWVLGVLALIALIILMYGGFQMVTSAGDEDKYSSGFTILKHAAQGLILIGIARFVISIIFRLVNQVTENAPPANSGG